MVAGWIRAEAGRSPGSGRHGTRLDELLEPAQIGLEDRAERRRHDERAEVGEDRRDEQLVPADDRRRAVGAAFEGDQAVALERPVVADGVASTGARTR